MNRPCRSEHARDGGVSGDVDVGGTAVIASMLAPTEANLCIGKTLTPQSFCDTLLIVEK